MLRFGGPRGLLSTWGQCVVERLLIVRPLPAFSVRWRTLDAGLSSRAARYPLVNGQGNFGSRDGDGAAAMRYTQARLAQIARLLLDEIDEGTVDFVPNYDGSTEEPRLLPARPRFDLHHGRLRPALRP